MDHDRLLSIYTPFSTEPIISSNDDSPGSRLILAIRSIGALFHELARKFATPDTPERIWLSMPPSPLFKTPSLIKYSFVASKPPSS